MGPGRERHADLNKEILRSTRQPGQSHLAIGDRPHPWPPPRPRADRRARVLSPELLGQFGCLGFAPPFFFDDCEFLRERTAS